VQTKGKTNWTKSHARHQPAQKSNTSTKPLV